MSNPVSPDFFPIPIPNPDYSNPRSLKKEGFPARVKANKFTSSYSVPPGDQYIKPKWLDTACKSLKMGLEMIQCRLKSRPPSHNEKWRNFAGDNNSEIIAPETFLRAS